MALNSRCTADSFARMCCSMLYTGEGNESVSEALKGATETALRETLPFAKNAHWYNGDYLHTLVEREITFRQHARAQRDFQLSQVPYLLQQQLAIDGNGHITQLLRDMLYSADDLCHAPLTMAPTLTREQAYARRVRQ